MVHEHGGERKYKCDFCPADFIQSWHKTRHMNNFHGENSDPNKQVSIRRRGPNKPK